MIKTDRTRNKLSFLFSATGNAFSPMAFRLFVVVVWIISNGVSFGTDQNKQSDTKQNKDVVPKTRQISTDQMKSAIIKKNIFKPGREPPMLPKELPADPQPFHDIGPRPLNRPFTVIACDCVEEVPHAYLQFDKNPPDVRAFKVSDVIELIVEIIEIRHTYIRCRYDTRKVRIDVGETSNDALVRLRGFDGRDYEFRGITVTDDVSFAYFQIEGRVRPIRVEVGDWLGKDEIVDIQPGQVKVILENGEEIYIPQTTPVPGPID